MRIGSITRTLAFASVLIVATSCMRDQDHEANSETTHQVDHIIVAVADLEAGIDEFREKTGIEPVFGGIHPGRGTQNALVALGAGVYLEILAPQTDIEIPEELEWMLELETMTPTGFAVSTSDIESTASILSDSGFAAANPSSGSRATPAGDTLMWTTTAISNPAIEGAPFFIEWHADSPHPASTSPAGCELRSLSVATNQQSQMSGLFTALGLAITVVAGQSEGAGYDIVIDCPNGEVRFN